MSGKTIDFSKTVYELCSGDPEAVEILAQLGFTDITKPGVIATAGRFMTVPKGAAMKKIDMSAVEHAFAGRGYEIIKKEESE